MALQHSLRTACLAAVVFAHAENVTESTTEAPEVVLAKAKDAFEEAKNKALEMTHAYEDYVTRYNTSEGIEREAKAAEDVVYEAMGDRVSEAHKELDLKLANLTSWDGSASEVADLAQQVGEAGKELAKADKEFAKATHHEYSRLRSQAKKESKEAAEEAKKQAKSAKEAARALERAQRNAGVAEHVYEGEFDVNEDATEATAHRAGSLKDKAEDKIEKKFSHVEKSVEKFEHEVTREGKHERKAALREAKAAKKDAKKELKEEAKVAESLAKAKEAEEKQEDEHEHEDADTGSSTDAPSENATVELAQVADLRVTESSWALASMMAMLVSVVFGVKAQRNRRVSLAQGPLLG